jgi:hypothetical protein
VRARHDIGHHIAFAIRRRLGQLRHRWQREYVPFTSSRLLPAPVNFYFRIGFRLHAIRLAFQQPVEHG